MIYIYIHIWIAGGGRLLDTSEGVETDQREGERKREIEIERERIEREREKSR